jgi:arabinogalactan oligomer/maltooligosaccharide transport system substrate-binding protein
MHKRLGAGVAALMATLTLILAACGGSSSSTASIDFNTATNVTIWHIWQGDYVAAKKAIFDKYTAMHPKITFTLVNQDDAVKKAQTAVKAGSGPDILVAADDNLGSLALSQTVVPLDQYISKDYLSQNYSKPAADALTFGGKVYGVPETLEAVTIMYNKSLVSDADAAAIKNTDDLLAFAKKFNAANAGKYGIVWDVNNVYQAAAFFYGFGTKFVDETGSVGINTAAGISAAKYIASFNTLMPSDVDYGKADTLFKGGQAAMIINGPWAYSDYNKALSTNLGFKTIPVVTSTGKAGAPFVGVKSMWVTKSAKNPALMADILKFYTQADNQVSMVGSTGEIPANTTAQKDASVSGKASIKAFIDQANNGVPLPNTPYMGAVWGPTGDALKVIWLGKQSAEDALKAAQSAVEKNVSDIKAAQG